MFPPPTKEEDALQNRVWGLLARAYAMLESGGSQHAPTETRILAACSVAGIAKCLADAAVMYKSIPQKPIQVDVSKDATMNLTGSDVTVSVTVEPEWHDRVVRLVEAINIAAMFPVKVQCAPSTINITLRDDEDTIYLLSLVASKLLDKAGQELKEANRLE